MGKFLIYEVYINKFIVFFKIMNCDKNNGFFIILWTIYIENQKI